MAVVWPVVEQFLPLGPLNPRRMCAPRQLQLADVPVVELEVHEVHNLGNRYRDFLNIIIRRAERISPALYYGKPITPYPNPVNHPDPTKGHSYFRVLLRSLYDESTLVELIIRDFDLYLLGFRKYTHGRWSTWYVCKDDIGFPGFLNADHQEIPFDGGHEHKPDIGGTQTLDSLFYALAGYYPGQGYTSMMIGFQQAIIIIPEALRFHYVANEIIHRFTQGVVQPTSLNQTENGWLPLWGRIGNWRNFCGIAIRTGLAGGVIHTNQAMGNLQYHTIYQINSFMGMLDGLRVLKRIQECPPLEPRNRQTRPAYGQRVANPGFIGLDDNYPVEDAAGSWWFP